MKELKKRIYQLCSESVDTRIAAIKSSIEMAEEASFGEVSSSMGDKYETGRSMMQLEIQKYEVQMAEARKLRNVLNEINPNLSTDDIQLGSLAETEQGNFYLSVSIGKVKVDDYECFAISMQSPAGQAIFGLKANDTYELNGKTYKIKAVR
ncbi:MAG: 3-oxoacyl-ACP synthase [Cyclobacteriaceae bacterium]